ncbi:MAG TPA: serine/threonine-protein kinase [Enhygromyxa sp.]|nr:serine/threonine-protein kinase [Enhygromyxa sp.]
MPDSIKPDHGGPLRVGDYLIHRLIGEGGMARVYEGEEVLSHRRVAVKVLRTELAYSERVRRQFLTEMGILANLDDPHIVRCLLCTQFEGRPVMVMELLEGWTLREMLAARVALPWREAVGYAVQIARALQTAHSRNPPIVHRDLKPENVMVLPDGRIKVMDFGIAKILQSVTATTNHEVGTLQYMSPEHIDARPVDGRADLFALGLVLWEMLAGHPPFRGNSPRELLDKLCTEPTPRLPEHVRPGLPPHIETLIYRLLEKDPNARPASAGEVVAQLEPWTKSVTVRVTTEERRPIPTPPPAHPQVSLNTVEIVEGARKGPLERRVEQQVEAIAEELGRFGRATSATVVRVLLGLLVLPAGALIFVGVPMTLGGLGLGVLEDDGIDLDKLDPPSWVTGEFALLVAIVAVVVFVRACWAHRRGPIRARMFAPWWLIGGLLMIGWIVATGIEVAPQSSLYPPVHGFFLASNFVWLMITTSWATGRIASRLFRRLERPRASD